MRRFALLCSINQVFWYLFLSILYLPFGPWFIGEILKDYYGVCFAWGIFVNKQFLKVDFQYAFGLIHVFKNLFLFLIFNNNFLIFFRLFSFKRLLFSIYHI